MNKENDLIPTIVGAMLAFLSLCVFMMFSHVLWPTLKFGGRMLQKGASKAGRSLWAKLTKRPQKPVPAELPTPDIFKGLPNLAKAREMQLD